MIVCKLTYTFYTAFVYDNTATQIWNTVVQYISSLTQITYEQADFCINIRNENNKNITNFIWKRVFVE